MGLANSGDVKHITRLQVPTSVKNFFGNNFSGFFEQHLMPVDFLLARKVVSQPSTANDIDLTNPVKNDLEGLCAVGNVAAWTQGKIEVSCFRIQKRHQLRIIHKQVDVMAFTVIDLQHERGSATQSPSIDDGYVPVCLPDDRYCNIKKFAPATRGGRVHVETLMLREGRGSRTAFEDMRLQFLRRLQCPSLE